jgi:hypothetical protein
MVASPTGLGPEYDCSGEGQQQLYTTDPSSRQRERSTSTSPKMSDSNKDLVVSPRRVLYSKTDWPTDRHTRIQHMRMVKMEPPIEHSQNETIHGEFQVEPSVGEY